MMKQCLQMSLMAVVVIFSGAWSQNKQPVSYVQKAQHLMGQIHTTRKAHRAKQTLHRKHNVQFGPTPERMAFEMAQGEVFRFVCDMDKKTLSATDKKALINLVLDLNGLKIDSDTMFEVNQCFRSKVVENTKLFFPIARQMGRGRELAAFLRRNKPIPLDEP